MAPGGGFNLPPTPPDSSDDNTLSDASSSGRGSSENMGQALSRHIVGTSSRGTRASENQPKTEEKPLKRQFEDSKPKAMPKKLRTEENESPKSSKMAKVSPEKLDNLDASSLSSSSEDDVYEVEEILDYYKENGKELFLIKWAGWTKEWNTWEDKENVNGCEKVLVDFFFVRVGEIIQCKQIHANNPRKMNQILKQLFCCPDPRPLRERVEYFLFHEVQSPPTDKDLMEAHKKFQKGIKWPQAKLEKQLFDALVNSLNAEQLKVLKTYAMGILAEYRFQDLSKELKKWERGLNEITKECPKISVVNEVDFVGPPEDFTYINGYEAGKGVKIPTDPLVGCDCKDTCLTNKKQCCPQINEAVFAYNAYKRVNVTPGSPIYECNRRCECDESCVNRVVQDGTVSLKGSHLCIYRTPNNKGWGVKTMKPIKKGTFVALYAGEVIRSEEADTRGKDYDRDGLTYLFDLDLNETEDEDCPFVVDAKKMGNISHFFNHSCDPNLTVYNVFVDCIDVNLPKLALFACRDIAKSEELTFDYLNKKDGENGAQKPEYPCLCGAKNCRKFLF